MSSAGIETHDLIEAAANGDSGALNSLFDHHRQRIHRMVAVRIDARLAPRIDVSDIVQDAYLEAARRFPEYVKDRPVLFHLWLRQIALDRLADAYRRHVGAQRRSVDREDDSVSNLARKLLSRGDTPGRIVMRQETARLVHDVLRKLSTSDREILVMRHLEELSAAEIADVLGINENTAKSRQRRALERFERHLRRELSESP